MDKIILEQTDAYFSDKIEKYGATSRGVDWKSQEAQRIRFEQLTKLLCYEKDGGFSLCDYGCGYGYYSEYLREMGYQCDYTGMDVSGKMIACAEQRYGMQKDTVFLHGTELEGTYDYIVASGIFNVRQTVGDEVWTAYMMEVLEKFHEHSRCGFAFNCLTKYSDSDRMKEYLYYADPLFWFDYAKKHFSRTVGLLHDYGAYDFTLLVRKNVDIS